MGLFDFFFKKTEPQNPVSNMMPTVSADKELFVCYDEVFAREVKSLQGFSPDELKKILTIIKSSDGGFLNMGGYHKSVYEQFFINRKWVWLEFEEWNDRFSKMGDFPMNWQHIKGMENRALTVQEVFGSLRVAELKEFLASENIVVPPKSKKDDLVKLVYNVPNIETKKAWLDKVKEISGSGNKALYAILMRTIHFRAKALFDKRRAEKVGVKKFSLQLTYEQDRRFVDLAISLKKQEVPPYFPQDLTFLAPVIPDFDD